MEDLMTFTEGEIVGTVNEFKTEQDFVDAVNEEFSRTFEVESVKRVYIRWYRRPPEFLSGDFPDGCYATCNKSGRGAFECFMIEG